jgi:hypothetical protein
MNEFILFYCRNIYYFRYIYIHTHTYSLKKEFIYTYNFIFFTKAWIIRRCKKYCSLIIYILHSDPFHVKDIGQVA